MTKKPVPVYLDDQEREMLEELAKHWGCSYSAVFKRLLREGDEKLDNNKKVG